MVDLFDSEAFDELGVPRFPRTRRSYETFSAGGGVVIITRESSVLLLSPSSQMVCRYRSRFCGVGNDGTTLYLIAARASGRRFVELSAVSGVGRRASGRGSARAGHWRLSGEQSLFG